ncbi:MAG: hypothetical protein HOP19_20975 [Acidobacteria bacterium]|nr:hypothetical protein [Acidobacteriota bacterium]
MQLSAKDIQPILDLYERGFYLQAHAAALQLAPLKDWQGTDAKVLAGRMCYALGAARQAQRLHYSAWRHDKLHAEARYFYARALSDRSGVLRAWWFLQSIGEELPNATPNVQADWYGLHAQTLGNLRDFDRAEAALAKAEACAPTDPYVWVERAGLLEMEDRYDEALQAAEHALLVRPWYRPAIQTAAHLLVLLEREQEALQLLKEAITRIESGSIAGQLAQLQSDLELYQEARANWELFAERMPLLDEDDQPWLNARRSDAAYYCGDYEAALAFAEKARGFFFKRVAENLRAAQSNGNNAQRLALPVNFIRQHHMTCAPATLSMISRYWQKSVEHLGVAEQICYGGTTDYSERKWAMEQGYVTREFCVNRDDAVKLIERGVPFTLATVDPGNAHLQAVSGYDARRGTLLLRDPYVSSLGEALADELVKHYRSSGPRGMALVPLDQADKLADLELMDAALYDHVYQIQDALDRHDRESAMTVWQTLQGAHPEHRLTHWSRLIIAWYDDDNTQILASVEKLLEQFPEDANLKMSKIFALRTLSRSEERLAYLAELCAWHQRGEPTADNDAAVDGDKPAADNGTLDNAVNRSSQGVDEDDAKQLPSVPSVPSVPLSDDNDPDQELTEKEKKDSRRYFDPLFWQQYAEELSTDARMHGKALRLLQRTLRYRSQDAHSISILANILWAQRRFEIATELYRFAACLKDTSEHYVQAYFIAARYLGQRQSALQHLESRFKRFGKRSGAPARTLSSALEQVGDDVRALAVLDEALASRPEDGELWLYASDAQARNGNFDKAEQYAAQAEGKAPRTACLRGKALIAFYRGALTEALQHWREVLEAEPQAIDATRNVSRLIAETEGREVSHAFLRERCECFPHNYPLNQLLVEALREDPAAAEQALRRLIEIDPNESWGRRELAYKLIELQRYDEAQAEAETARQLEPQNPFSFCTLGAVQAARGDVAEARESFKEAIRLSADTEFAIGELMNHSHTPAEKLDALNLLAAELEKQVTFGEGVLAYREYAKASLPMEEVQAFLQRALDARPDLPLVWTAMIQQLVDMQSLDEALRVGEEATQRFPLLPRLWLDLASVQQVRLNVAGEITALQQALRIAPKWGFAAQQLADAYLRAGEKQKAIEILERAIALTPLDPYNHGCLADVLWKLNEKDAALARIQPALKLEPEYEWGWRALRDWAADRKQPELATELAREVTQQRPGQALAWLTLARTITDARKLDERLAAIDRALVLQPRMIEAYALKARLFTEAHRFDEARAACRPAVFGENVPAGLRIVAANVEAERGAVNDAVKLLREIVTDEPNFYPAWAQLADWYRANKDHGYYREAAEAMARLQPHYPIALGYLAEARQLTLDRAGAKEALQRALQLDPMYEYGAITLFDWQYEDKEWDDCETTVAHLKQYLGGDETYLRELKLALHNEDFQTARQRLQELCVSESEERHALDQALSAATMAGVDTPQAERWKTEADSVLDYVVDARLANANAVAAWVERNAKREQYDKVQQWLDALPERDELWRRGSIVFLETLVTAHKKHRMRTYVTHHQEALRAHDWSWGNVGFFYLDMKEPRSAIAWLNDWRERAELEPWMLWNLVLALHQRQQLAPAYEVSEHALTLPPDSTSDAHTLLLAVEDFLRDHYDLGSKRLEHVNVNALREWDKFVYELASCLQDADHARIEQYNGHRISHQTILQRIAEARRVTADARMSNVLVPLHRRVVWHIARRSGNPLLMMWVGLQLMGQAAWRSVFGDTEGA